MDRRQNWIWTTPAKEIVDGEALLTPTALKSGAAGPWLAKRVTKAASLWLARIPPCHPLFRAESVGPIPVPRRFLQRLRGLRRAHRIASDQAVIMQGFSFTPDAPSRTALDPVVHELASISREAAS